MGPAVARYQDVRERLLEALSDEERVRENAVLALAAFGPALA